MNLLTEPLITAATSDGRSHLLSLPALYAMAVRDELASWPRLRPHQEPAWHMLLVQLAVLASRAAGVPQERLVNEDEWRGALRALTPDHLGDAPWCLVVDDWLQPGFMQPACEKIAAKAEFKSIAVYADSIDMLVTAKNHDLKSDRLVAGSPEEWLFALVTLQTTEGFLGAGNYGIARMNGGFSSRPMLRCHSVGLGAGAQIMRDVRILLNGYEEWLERVAEDCRIGLAGDLQPLLWLLPWDGRTSLSLESFHPLAIEVCRRIRLERGESGLRARTAGSKVARIAAGEAKGNIGDPWAPIELKDPSKAFTVTSEGYSYRRMVDLLDPGKYRRPWLARPDPVDIATSNELAIKAAGIARGQGKTEGVHRRTVLLSARTTQLFAGPGGEFARRSARHVEMAGNVARSALRPALIQTIQGKDPPDWKKPSNDPLTRPWLNRFDAEVDSCFFAELDRSFEQSFDDEAAELRWSQVLSDIARRVFEAASVAVPRNGETRLLAQALGANLLQGALKKQLPLLKRPAQEGGDEAQ